MGALNGATAGELRGLGRVVSMSNWQRQCQSAVNVDPIDGSWSRRNLRNQEQLVSEEPFLLVGQLSLDSQTDRGGTLGYFDEPLH